MLSRTAIVERSTNETEIFLSLDLDGSGKAVVQTGIPFFDHMLCLFARHGLMDLEVNARGDREVDFHHTVEDVGICLGRALEKALGDKKGIRRYGFALMPMDEALAQVAIDLSGRPFFALRTPNLPPLSLLYAGTFPAQLLEEFFRAFSMHGMLTLHLEIRAARDTHHLLEASFKGVARALAASVEKDERVSEVPSTKGVL
ncbi:imidazoleglycerol-phosphate dehydratase [Methylacidimicrobium cyclopophantes]|uniref:Imidazoleglycerol-phosphate dehydratase n=1 Tax=Methylacidimicrobium cyclopophantes TaxID=1041766 RepID=A0A5E6MHD8_9BACT|nr:imidazoleglycerol-phosphate dehydratase HisB [Methylacidimicrobium cyclopophantes]VVM05425.1 imidazoleglycerol-phosphate dehydratase [Methylacidimicrobium cyclopophantes]